MVEEREEILAFYEELIAKLTDVSALEAKKTSLEEEAAFVMRDMNDWINQNARVAMRQETYSARYDELNAKLTAVKDGLQRVDDEIMRRGMKKVNAAAVMDVLRGGAIGEFDAGLFGGIVDRVVVNKNSLVFRLKDGSERTV